MLSGRYTKTKHGELKTTNLGSNLDIFRFANVLQAPNNRGTGKRLEAKLGTSRGDGVDNPEKKWA